MSTAGIAAALPFVLRWEGGLVDDPEDPGGRTNQGITQRVYDGWRRRQGLPAQDVESIADAEVKAIYASDYWAPPRCDLREDPLDLVQFDTAVNMGVGRAVRFLQGVAGCSVDGNFGPGTERAVAGCDHGQLVAHYRAAREAYYRKLTARDPKLDKFLKGWLNRLDALRKEAGLPGFESVPASVLDHAELDHIRKIPDIGPHIGPDSRVDARFDP
jgi:lysozyme family protein